MATYIFECKKCEKQHEKEIPMSDYDKEKEKQICECGEKMVRVFIPINLTEYKCTGFYDTDNRGKKSR